MHMNLKHTIVAGLRSFHNDEAGEGVVGAVSIGAVGVLLATVIFSVMKSAITSTGGNGLAGVAGNAIGGLSSLLPSFGN